MVVLGVRDRDQVINRCLEFHASLGAKVFDKRGGACLVADLFVLVKDGMNDGKVRVAVQKIERRTTDDIPMIELQLRV
ncbi:MAG: hypothetical protein AAFP26_06205, partial [Planctomycetota bacterium]